MPVKEPETSEDKEVQDRVRAYVRREMREREIGVNAMARKLKVGEGYLSRVIAGVRGFRPGFMLKVRRALAINGDHLLADDPPAAFYETTSWDWTRPLPRPGGGQDASPPDDVIPSHARPPAQSTEQKKAGHH